jgi:hypothetical protein
MPTLSSLLVSATLASSVSMGSMLHPQPSLEPPATAPAPPAQKDGEVLRGPKVPQKGIDSNRQFTGGKAAKDPNAQKDGQRPPAQMGSKPMIEQNAFFAALDSLDFGAEVDKSVKDAREEFVARVAEWEKTTSAKRKELFEKRKKASSSEPPSEEFKKQMNELEASRPKLAELQQRVYGMLSEEQGAKLKDAYDAELKRVRDEIARKAEAERKRQAETKKAPPEGKKPAPEGKPTDAAPRREKGAPATAPTTPPTGDKPAPGA